MLSFVHHNRNLITNYFSLISNPKYIAAEVKVKLISLMDLHSSIKYKEIFVLQLHTPSQVTEMNCFFQILKEEESYSHITHKLEQSLTKLWSSSFGALRMCLLLVCIFTQC